MSALRLLGRSGVFMGDSLGFRFCLLFCALASSTGSVRADEKSDCPAPHAFVTSAQGQVDARRSIHEAWHSAQLNERLCAGAELRTGSLSRAQLRLLQTQNDSPKDGTLMQLNERSSVVLPKPDSPWWLQLVEGALHLLSRTPENFTVKTRFVNAKIEGTEFLVLATPQQSEVTVFEGKVAVSNDFGEAHLQSGETAVADASHAPRRELRLHPRDAVQWALYYPPILDLRSQAEATHDTVLQQAAEQLEQGHLSEALSMLGQAIKTQPTPERRLAQAALLLSIGQVPPAETALKQVPDSSESQALQAIIALAQNRKDEAQQLAETATRNAPQSATPWVALSYVQQAHFDLPAALTSARKAKDLAPQNALAWSRVAELELALGDRKAAIRSAEQAQQLAPNLARTQTVTGFAALTQFKLEQATQAFSEAIRLDAADPLPRLGLGLAQIRQGHLTTGRQTLEGAANLDPDNALVRSYLGKAYFEERRPALAATELANAKALDPKDPTPWFYDAIRKQTENRPVEALLDLQQSIALNGNRAVYRSKLGLDGDEAARGAALGRLYRDLRFEQSALSQAWAANSADPSDPTAHRMLSDTYAGLPRRDVARVSELLQSQLLQPTNVSPVQPQLAETNLFLLGGLGPAQTSLNEFSPLFMRNGMSLLASGLVGSQGLGGDEVVLTGIHDRLSYSLGQLHYGFGGFRTNSDFDTNLYTAYTQYSLGERGNVQLELRHQDAEEGDLRELADPLSATGGLDTFRRTSQRQSVRVGTHLNLAPGSDVLASFAFAGVSRLSTSATPSPFPLDSSGLTAAPLEVQARYPATIFNEKLVQNRADTFTLELQHLWQQKRLNSVIGVGYTRRSGAKATDTGFSFDRPLPASFADDLQTYVGYPLQDAIFIRDSYVTRERDREESIDSMFNAYSYLTFHIAEPLDVIAGAELQTRLRDSSRAKGLTADTVRLNPKFGLVWTPQRNTRLRAAWLRRMTGPLATAQTIEPTHVAGFNQLFNEEIGTQFELYGFGVDQRLGPRLTAGFEVTWRDAQVPVLEYSGTGFDGATSYVHQWEQQHRGYLQWAATDRLTLSGEYFFEAFDRDQELLVSNRSIIPDVNTHRIPVSLAYFHPCGFFARATESFVLQDLGAYLSLGFDNQPTKDARDPVSKSFWVTDLVLGYRLPHRRGLVTFGVNNLFDARTPFQDANPAQIATLSDRQDFTPPRYSLERAFFAQITLAF